MAATYRFLCIDSLVTCWRQAFVDAIFIVQTGGWAQTTVAYFVRGVFNACEATTSEVTREEMGVVGC